MSSSSFWTGPLSALFQALQVDPDGLNQRQVEARTARYGPNLLQTERRRALALEFLLRLRNPLVVLLLVAAAIAAATGDPASFVIITLVVLASVTLDFVQEHRANRAAEALRASVAVHATVRRDGAWVPAPVSVLVPGDVIQLAAGDVVPADARLIEARDLYVNQALLTGEPYPVEKQAQDEGAGTQDVTAAANAVLMGTSVLTGRATAVVARTGPQTMMGTIAEGLRRPEPPSAFERGTRQFGFLIMQLTLLLALFVLLVNLMFHRPWLETFMFSLALAVGLTPELLPMIISVTLSRGAMRMARRQVVVKRLSAVQDLGSMDVLCTDKTGTLTEARIRLERHVDPFGTNSEDVLRLAYLNSHFETGLRSPLDDAILAHEHIDVSTWTKVDEMPFGFERRRVSVLVDDGRERLLVVKGAPEDIVRLSSRYQTEGDTTLRAMHEAAFGRMQAQYDALAQEGFRVLAVAWRKVERTHEHALVDDETELTLAGFAAFLDPPKASAGEALKALAASGVTVKVLTGDNELVTRHVCASIGLDIQAALSGAQIAQLDDQALAAQADRTTVFCRVSPAQKTRVLNALKQRGHIVGFLGDGVNDAPALQAADVGISVDTAVDVAKEAADLILLEHDLSALHEGVREGRRSFVNVMKYIMMGTSSNFGNMFSMAGASLFLPFLPMLPTQILLNNLLYDLSEIAIPFDRVDESRIAKPVRWDLSFIRRFMLTLGPVSSLFDFLTFFLLIAVFGASATLFHTGWFVESIATQVLVIFLIRTRGHPLRSSPHPLLLVTSLGAVLVAIALPFTPVARWLGFAPLPPSLLAALAALVAGYLVCAELAKQWFYRRLARSI